MGKTPGKSKENRETELLAWWSAFGEKLQADREAGAPAAPRRRKPAAGAQAQPARDAATPVAPAPVEPADVPAEPRGQPMQAPACGTTARLFFALWPDVLAAADTALLQSSRAWPAKAPMVAMANLHMTLAFLGDLPREAIGPLTNLRLPALDVGFRLDQLEIWPGSIAVLTPSKVPDALVDLHQGLIAQLKAVGAPFDRRAFRPHVTIARRAGAVTAAPLAIEPILWRPQPVVLVESAQRRYAPVKTWA